MANEPDSRVDFSLDEQSTPDPVTTEEVDTPDAVARDVSAPYGDKPSAATELRGSYLLRDSFHGQEQNK